MRCAARTQACRCESKGSHYYCQKEPSSLLKVWRVLLLQSTHKSTQLQNLRENALNIFCRVFESAFTLVLIPPHVHAFRGANHLLRQILRQLGLYEADGCVPQARAAWILCRAVCNTASTACMAYSCWFGPHRGREKPRAQSIRWKQDVAHCVLSLAVADFSQPVYGPLDVQGCRFRQCRSILSLPARRGVNQELQ